MKKFYFSLVLFSSCILIIALSLVITKMKDENRKMKSCYSSTLLEQSKEEKKKEKVLSDREEAARVVENFIPLFFLANKANFAENVAQIKNVVSDGLYNRLKDEDFAASDYSVEIVSAPVYALVDDGQENRYHYTSIISLQYSTGMIDYGIHMQIWNFICGYNDGKMRILNMELQEYIE